MTDNPDTEAAIERGGAIAGKSRSVYEAIFREMSDAVFLIDVKHPDQGYTFIYRRNNASHQQLTGLSADELRGRTPRELLGDEQGEVVAENYRRCVEQGETIEYEERLDLPGGTSHWQTKLTPIADSGQVTQIVGVARDITDQKEQERRLERIHRRFETVMETMSAAVFLKDADGQYLMMNQACRELFNLKEQDIVGLTDDDLLPPDVAEKARTDDRRVIKDGEMIEIEETVPTTAGNTVRLTRKSPVYDEDGEVVALCGVSTDITDRKQAERELKENKKRLTEQNTALESLAQIVTDAERTADQRITDLLDLGTTYLDLNVGILSEIDGSEYTVRNVVDPAESIEPGDTFDLTDTYCSLVYDAEEPVSFHSADEGGVKDHPAYQKQGLESYVGTPVFVDDQRYGTLNFSRPASRVAPIKDAEESFVRIMAQWIGTELTRQQRQEELERTSQFLRETQEVAKVGGWEVSLRSETMRWSDELYRIHGLPLDADPTPEEGIEFYHPDDRDTIREAFDRLTAEGEPYDLELRIVTTDDEVRWVHTRGEPRYEDDEIVAVHGTFRDITERKERELELQRQNRRLDEFASVVSHDLRNPLDVALGRAAILQDESGDEYRDHITEIVTALERMESIVTDTLTLARQGETVDEMNSIPIVDFVDKCWAGVDTAEATLQIEDEFTVRGDRDRLRHVFENLFRNAVEHGGEDVTIRVGRAGESCMYVEDDGRGIPPGERDEVFDPGQTSATGGTGFGLTIVRRIAEAHNWDVTVTDGRDGGARFEFDSPGMIDE